MPDNTNDDLDFSNIFDTAVKQSEESEVPSEKKSIHAPLMPFRRQPEKKKAPVYGSTVPEPTAVAKPVVATPPPVARPVSLNELHASTVEVDAKEAEHDEIYKKVKLAIENNTPGVEPEFVTCIAAVLRTGASDLHFACDTHPRIRVDGGLVPVRGTSKWDNDKMNNVVTALADRDQRNAYDETHELDLAYSVGDKSNPIARFRVNVYHDNNGIVIAFRIIPTKIKSVKDLGLPESFANLSQLPRGLVLVCGPTGSGKSTTLAAIIDRANETRSDHIITIEDPIEFLYHHKKCIVNQREVGTDTMSFDEALKRALREDPDIIEIGEMRDFTTISAALTAAETGHLVFGTLHTQDAPQTIDRIINVFPAEQQSQVSMMLSMALKAVIVQTLVPKIGGGRVCATEVMYNTTAVASSIREHKTEQLGNYLQSGKKLGMHTMDADLARLIKSNKITMESALEHCQNAENLKQLSGEI